MTTVSIADRIEAVHERLQRARELFAQGNVQPVIGMTDHCTVSSSEGKGTYLVNGECTCPDAGQRTETHNGWCKHNLAVELFKEGSGEAKNGYSKEQVKDDVEALYGPQDNGQKGSHRRKTENRNTDGRRRNTQRSVPHEQS